MRLKKLNIQVPDPVLLVASLDKFAVVLAKTSMEVAFRLQVGRAALQVNLVPTMQGVERFTQVPLAEGEAARHMVCRGANTEAKVRALDIDNGNSDGRREKTDSENRGGESGSEKLTPRSDPANGGVDGSQSNGGGSGSEELDATPSEESGGGGTDNERSVMPVCKYFLGEYGCKKGGLCDDYRQKWGSDNGRGRCWNCGSTKHLKVNCPANGAHQGNPKMRAAIEVASESEVENTEVENTTEVKGESGSASEVSEEEADANGVLCKGTHAMRSFRLSAKVLKVETKRGRVRVGPCSTVEPLAFFGLRCRRRNMQAEGLFGYRDGHGEGDPEEGQQSNGNR